MGAFSEYSSTSIEPKDVFITTSIVSDISECKELTGITVKRTENKIDCIILRIFVDIIIPFTQN
jgi:hypothetical protein